MKRAVIAGLALAALSGSAVAADPSAWKAFHRVDPVTDQVRDGAAYDDGEDGFRVVCTHQKAPDTRRRFWVEVMTGAHLGRGSFRNLTYRIGDEPPTTSRWEYAPRVAVPTGLFEDRHLVERIVEHKAERAIFRLWKYDGTTYDLTVPIDAPARDLMAQTLERCRS